MKKLVCAVLSAVIAISMVGCTFKTPATVLTINGESVSAGIYLIYQYLAFSNAANEVEDSKKKVLSQKVEDKDAAQWIQEQTLESVQRHIYVEKAFAEQELSFTDEELATAKETAEANYMANEKMFKKNGIGKETYVAFYNVNRMASKLSEVFTADEANKVTDADAKKYMEEKYLHIYSVYFPVYTPEYVAITDEQRIKIEEIAQKLQKEIVGGKALTKELATTYLKEAFEISGHEMTDSAVDQFFSSDYISDDSNNYFSDALKGAMMASKIGDVAFNNEDGTIMVWSHVETFTSDEEFEENKADIVTAIQSEKFNDVIDASIAEDKVDIDKSAQNTYSVKNVVLE